MSSRARSDHVRQTFYLPAAMSGVMGLAVLLAVGIAEWRKPRVVDLGGVRLVLPDRWKLEASDDMLVATQSGRTLRVGLFQHELDSWPGLTAVGLMRMDILHLEEPWTVGGRPATITIAGRGDGGLMYVRSDLPDGRSLRIALTTPTAPGREDVRLLRNISMGVRFD